MIKIHCLNDGWRRMRKHAWRRALRRVPAGFWRPELVSGDLAVVVLIQFIQNFGRTLNFLGGNHSVVVGVNHRKQGRTVGRAGGRPAVFGLLGDGGFRQQGEHERNDGGFHGQ